ncbi:MAG: helix-turn-helix transcriptional regulator [Ottowia sp.]
MNSDLLTYSQVCTLLNISRDTCERYVKSGRLPQPIRFSARCVRWEKEAVLSHLRAMQTPAPSASSVRARAADSAA